MMEENNKGKGFGIFYAVVGVATLVVAIIGATFAFFSATAQDKTIGGTTAEASGLELSVTQVTKGTGATMIPVNFKVGETNEVDTEDQFEKAITNNCKDSNGNNICNIYKIVVTNPSGSSKIDINGNLKLNEVLSDNFRWQILNVTSEEKLAATEFPGHEVDSTTVTTNNNVGQIVRNGVLGAVTAGSTARKTLASKESVTYYVIVWLEESGKDQGTDAGKTYTGTVNFQAVNAQGVSSGITASFSS